MFLFVEIRKLNGMGNGLNGPENTTETPFIRFIVLTERKASEKLLLECRIGI